jgi:hypothetical protein
MSYEQLATAVDNLAVVNLALADEVRNTQSTFEASELATVNAATTAVEAKDVTVAAKDVAVAASNNATAKEALATAAATSATDSEANAGISADAAVVSAATAVSSADTSTVNKDQAVAAKIAAELARDEAQEAAASLVGVITDRGSIDLSGGVYPTHPTTSSMWKVTVGGTVDGTVYGVGDTLMFTLANDSFYKIDNTELVSSVAGKTGAVTLNNVDVGLGSVDNTPDASKPVSTAQQNALNLKIDKTSIVDGLTSTDATKVLSAKQGKVLSDMVSNVYTKPESDVLLATKADKPDTDTKFADRYTKAQDDALLLTKVDKTAVTDIAHGGTGAITADAARAALLVPGRNRIINGAVSLAQRTAFTFASGVSGYGGPDRYMAANSNAGGSFTQSLSTLVDGAITKNCVLQTVNTALTDYSGNKYWTGITQRVEGYNCYDLKGQPVALSFLFRASITGTYTVAVSDSTVSQSYISTFAAVANTVTKVVVKVPAIPTAAVIPQTSGLGLSVIIGALNGATYQTAALNVWQAGNYLSASTATNWGLTVGATIAVSELQLEIGTEATPFERRSHALEQILCARYYQSGNSVTGGYSTTGTANITPYAFSTVMRVAPTLTYTVGGSANVAVYDVRDPLTIGFSIFSQVSSNGGYNWNPAWTANAEL